MKKISSALLLLIMMAFSSCNFFAVMTGSKEDEFNVTMSFDATKMFLDTNEMGILSLSVSENQNACTITWEYDENVLRARTDNYSAVLTGLSPGQSTVTARCGSASCSALITVTDEIHVASISDPYVYASADYVSVVQGESRKVTASLYGGSASDMEGFSYSISDSSVAEITGSGNTCIITGKKDGFATLRISHSRSAGYPYSILINCSETNTAVPYITSSSNVITINLNEEINSDFEVSLINGTDTGEDAFTYSFVDADGEKLSAEEAPVNITGTDGSFCRIQAAGLGQCFVRVMHPSASYPLDVLVRVVEDPVTASIMTSDDVAIISGTSEKTISVSLDDHDPSAVDPSKFRWTASEGAGEIASWQVYNGNEDDTGDTVKISGLSSGKFKFTVSYEDESLDVCPRNVIVIVRDSQNSAASATTSITTGDTYVKMYAGDERNLSVYLNECEEGDINRIKWNLSSDPDSGESAVIEWLGGTGFHSETTASSAARSASLSYGESASARIYAASPGIASIEVSHPKAIYPVKITVRVVEKKTGTETHDDSYITATVPLLKLPYGSEDMEIEVCLSDPSLDASLIEWSVISGPCSVSANGLTALLSVPAEYEGGSSSVIRASHPEAGETLITVLCYNDGNMETDLENFCQAYISSEDSLLHEMKTGQSELFRVSVIDYDGENPPVSWSVTGGKELINLESQDDPSAILVNAVSAGTARLMASLSDSNEIEFIIKISQEGIVDETQPCWISSRQSVLYFDSYGETQTVSVILHNVTQSAANDLKFEISDESLFSVENVSFNDGEISAGIISRSQEGEATLTVSHPLVTDQVLEISLRTGNKIIYRNEYVVYVQTSVTSLELVEGGDKGTFYSMLVHTEESGNTEFPSDFTYSVADTSVAEVEMIDLNTCHVTPVSAGSTVLSVSHPDAAFAGEVVITVNRQGDGTVIPYLTTKQNVFTVLNGEIAAVRVDLINSDSVNNAAWSWESDDRNVASITSSSGGTALIRGNGNGRTRIRVSHADCKYPLEIILICLDEAVAAEKPYVRISDSIVTLTEGDSHVLSAEVVGGSAGDEASFSWSSGTAGVALISSSGSSCHVKAVKKGMTRITVTCGAYPEIPSRTVLLVVEEEKDESIYITASRNIIKLNPDDDSEGIEVTATLNGGNADDGDDFSWWADDYNVVALDAAADTVNVRPLGISGSTKIHVTHPKAAKDIEISVVVSRYDEFAFEENSARVTAGNLYFFNLNVPEMTASYEIEYSSSNDDVCVISGSSSVAFVAGVKSGTALLTARMINQADSEVIAETMMSVSVVTNGKNDPVISLGNSIYSMKTGESVVFSAVISGNDLSENESSRLVWSTSNDCISITGSVKDDGSENFTGKDVYVTARTAGDATITVSHPDYPDSYQTMYCQVLAAGEVSISIKETGPVETSMDDGSFVLTALLENSTDYDSITWSAVKINGQNIIYTGNTTGRTCTCTPKYTGTTFVRAKLPDGKSAAVMVKITPAATLVLSTSTVHVIPGRSIQVPYSVIPSGGYVNWTELQADYTTTCFTWSDDKQNCILTINGLERGKDSGYAGSITGYVRNGSINSTPSLDVYVDYSLSLMVKDESENLLLHRIYNDNPDTGNSSKFYVYCSPPDLKVTFSVKADDGMTYEIETDGKGTSGTAGDPLFNLERGSTQISGDGIYETSRQLITLTPLREGQGTITVRAELIDSSGQPTGEVKETDLDYYAYYRKYDVVADESFDVMGAFSKITDDGKIHLGDGEEMRLSFRVTNENARPDWENSVITYAFNSGVPKELQADENSMTVTEGYVKDAGGIIYKINHAGGDDSDDNGKLTFLQTRNKAKTKIFNSEFAASDDTKNSKINWDAEETEIRKLLAPHENGLSAAIPLVYFVPADDAGGDARSKTYTLAHIWDYYKDIPVSPEEDLKDGEDLEDGATDDFNTFLEYAGQMDKYYDCIDFWLLEEEMISGQQGLTTIAYENQVQQLSGIVSLTNSSSKPVKCSNCDGKGYTNIVTVGGATGADGSSHPGSQVPIGCGNCFNGFIYSYRISLMNMPLYAWNFTANDLQGRNVVAYYKDASFLLKKENNKDHSKTNRWPSNPGSSNSSYIYRTSTYFTKGEDYRDYRDDSKIMVISADEFMKNGNYFVKGKKDNAGNYVSNFGVSNGYIINFVDTVLHERAVPAVTKDSGIKDSDDGAFISLTIRNGAGTENRAMIPVVLEKRWCQAYQSDAWQDATWKGRQRWTQK